MSFYVNTDKVKCKQNQKTNSTFLVQFFMIYNFAFNLVDSPLKVFKMYFVFVWVCNQNIPDLMYKKFFFDF